MIRFLVNCHVQDAQHSFRNGYGSSMYQVVGVSARWALGRRDY